MMDKQQAITAILARIQQTAEQTSRNPADIQLVAVSKRKPVTDIIAAYEAGLRHFGENYTEELAEKAEALKHLSDLEWHFIGHLQSRQTKAVAQYAHYFHALDRLKVAQRLSAQLSELGRELPVFLQVNVSGEESKSGFDGVNWRQQPEKLETLCTAIQEIIELPGLRVIGLMTMAPFDADTAGLHAVFKDLADLATHLQQKISVLPQLKLSMGMSGDFDIAIAEGATHVRIGSAIFGERS